MNSNSKIIPSKRIYFTYSLTNKIISVFSLIVLLFFSYVFLTRPINLLWIVGFIALLATGITLAFAPRYLEKKGEVYILKTVLSVFRFNMDYYEVEPCSKTEILHSVRSIGSGGMFGYIGYFWNKRLGTYLCFVSSLNQPMIKFKHKRTHKVIIVNGEV